jgi:hypothetical protein
VRTDVTTQQPRGQPPDRISDRSDRSPWPALPVAAWTDTYATLHMLAQVVGKTRLGLAPMMNHWWQTTLYVTERGLTTSPMPYSGGTVAVDFDFTDHNVIVRTSNGSARAIPLFARSVREFYVEYIGVLRALSVDVRIRGVPVEVEVAVPFAEDTQHASYDQEAANRWWRVMVRVDRVLKRFRARFEGKASPVHFFWGSFDLATTRFSGRGAPLHPGGAPNCPDYVMQEAYSRECSSCGFWPGGGAQDAAFYSYAYPEPAGYNAHAIRPAEAYYDGNMREFILPYDAVRNAGSPDDVLLDFLQSTYDAAADLAHWDRASLERHYNGANA